LCKSGHKNFVEGEGIEDFTGHGTHVTGLIEQYAGGSNYCFMIYKYYGRSTDGLLNETREVLALREALKIHANVINFSGGGSTFNEEEALLIMDHPEITF